MRGGEPLGGPGCRGEQHRVDLAGGGGGHRPPHDGFIRRRAPAVDRETHDIRAVVLEELVETVRTRSVVLDGDPAAAHALGEQVLTEFRRCLGLRHPVRSQTRLLDRATRLGSASHDLGAGQHRLEAVEQTGLIRRLHPPAEADAGRGDHDVGRVGDELPRPGDERLVVDVGHDRERGGGPHDRAVPLQRRRELAGSTIDGDDDRAAFERCGQGGAGWSSQGAISPAISRSGRRSPARATAPMTITAGLRTPAAAASATASASVVRVVRCSGV